MREPNMQQVLGLQTAPFYRPIGWNPFIASFQFPGIVHADSLSWQEKHRGMDVNGIFHSQKCDQNMFFSRARQVSSCVKSLAKASLYSKK